MTRPGDDKPIPTKPTWHYGGTFDAAWAGTLKVAQLTAEDDPELSKDYRLTLSAMAGAHVVTLDREQYLALPQDYDALTDFIPDPHLPFEIHPASQARSSCTHLVPRLCKGRPFSASYSEDSSVRSDRIRL